MASSSDKKLEEQLVEAGNNLLPPPASVDELLQMLDHVETLLVKVEQSPSKSMLEAVFPSMKALAADELLKHSDMDVKVAVACCISEITRITAPEAPYDDERMREVFQLIVSSFEDLSDQSSRTYTKRASILETVAKVRSCVVMLDLECEGLIADMFQHFLKAIRDYHPENVFSAMVTIITLVLEESEDISLELLSPVLASLKRDNQDVLPVARKLGERVFESCAAKLKPYLVQAVESEVLSLDDYSDVVVNICGVTCVTNNDGPASEELRAEENMLVEASSDDVPQAVERTLASSDEAAQVSEEIEAPSNHPIAGRSPAPIMSNGAVEDANQGPSAEPESSKNLEDGQHTDQLIDNNEASKAESGDLDSTTVVKLEPTLEQTAQSSSKKPEDGQLTDKLVDTSEVSNAECSDLDSTMVVKVELKSEPTAKRSSKKPEDGQHTDKSVDTSEACHSACANLNSTKVVKLKLKSEQTAKRSSMKSEDGQDTDQLIDNNEASKTESGDLESTKVGKLESKSEQITKRSSKKQEDGQHAHKLVDTNETSHAECGDLDSTKVVKLKLKSEQTAKRSSKKPEVGQHNVNEASKAESGDLDSTKVAKLEVKSEQTVKRRGRKLKSLFMTEPSGTSLVDSEKEADKPLDYKNDHNKEVLGAPSEEPCFEKAMPSGNEKETEQHSFPKEIDDDAVNVPSPSRSGSLPEENHPKKFAWPKKKLNQESELSADASKKVVEGASDSEVRPKRKLGKKVSVWDTTEDKTTIVVGGSRSDAKGKQLAVLGKMDVNNSINLSSLTKKDGRKRGQGKYSSDKDTTKSSSKDDKELIFSLKPSSMSPEDEDHMEETPKINTKRKRNSGKEKANDAIAFDESLVGLKVKVWWPEDEQFYEGVIHSFDSVKKKHKVLYDDGDEENLTLKKERWELIEGDSKTLVEQKDEHQSPDVSSELHKKMKAKTNAEKSTKQVKTEASRGGESSNKLKAAGSKPGRKSRDIEGKSAAAKLHGISEEASGSRSEEASQKGGGIAVDSASKSARRKSTAKVKEIAEMEESPATEKIPGNGKRKLSTAAKDVKSEAMEETPGKAKVAGSSKRKAADTSQSGGTGARSGKKRKRNLSNS